MFEATPRSPSCSTFIVALRRETRSIVFMGPEIEPNG